MKKKITTYTVSPLLQKTFIILGVATFLIETAGILYSFIMGMSLGPFDSAMLRMLPGMLLPALLFVLIFLLSNKTASRRWRIFMATMITSTVLIIQQVLLMCIYVVAAPTGIGELPPYLVYADLLSLIPVVLVTGGLIWYLKIRNISSNQASPRLQVVYIATLTISFVVLLGMTIWENLKPSPYGVMDLPSLLASILIPVFVPVVLFLISFMTAKKPTPVWNKVFVSLIYVTIAVFVSVCFGAGLMLVSQLNSGIISMDVANYGSMAASAIVFIAILVWHKKRSAY